jgi:hypothetical protein
VSDEDIRRVLRAARALLETRPWCQGAEARDLQGRPAHPAAMGARAWSVSGAVYRATGFDGTPERRTLYQRALTRLAEVVGTPLLAWNDAPDRRVSEVLAALAAAGGWSPSDAVPEGVALH